MPKTPKQSAWLRTVAKYRKDHPNTPNRLVFQRASKLYRSKTPSRSVTRKRKTPSRSVTLKRKTPSRTPSRVCRLYSTPKGKSPRHCLKFRATPKRHCATFSKGKKPKKCIRYSRTPVKR